MNKTTTRKLSAPQLAFLDELAAGNNQPPVTSGRKSVTLRSAWWRTRESLERLGLVERNPQSCFNTPRLTKAGVKARAFAAVQS